ncbi:hypothetical protein Q7P36_000360 [Cladosporium allicinum]
MREPVLWTTTFAPALWPGLYIQSIEARTIFFFFLSSTSASIHPTASQLLILCNRLVRCRQQTSHITFVQDGETRRPYHPFEGENKRSYHRLPPTKKQQRPTRDLTMSLPLPTAYNPLQPEDPWENCVCYLNPSCYSPFLPPICRDCYVFWLGMGGLVVLGVGLSMSYKIWQIHRAGGIRTMLTGWAWKRGAGRVPVVEEDGYLLRDLDGDGREIEAGGDGTTIGNAGHEHEE